MIGTKSQCITYLANIKNEDRRFEIKEYKETRGAKANNYFHRLVGLLAKGEKARFYAKKNELIMQYGNHELERHDDGSLKYEILMDTDSYKSDPIKHYLPTKYTEVFRGMPMRAFCMFKGTHTYSPAEMAHLIDCTRDECLGCGIPQEEVETFEEKRIMEELRRHGEAKRNLSRR